MRFLRVCSVFIPFVLVTLLAPTKSHAIRMYFSDVGPTGTPTVGSVPNLTLNPNDTGTLHVWVRLDDRPPTQKFASMAFDLETSNPAVAQGGGFTMANPLRADDDPVDPSDDAPRWDGTGNGAGAVAPFWVKNAFGTAVQSASIMNPVTAGTNPVNDPLYNQASRSYYIGALNFTAIAPGRTGLYFRTGTTGNVLGGSTGAPMQFGDTNVTHTDTAASPGGRGDTISADLALADAIITVAGITQNPHIGFSTDTPTGTLDVGAGRVSATQPGAGTLAILNHPATLSGKLVLDVDLSGVADLVALAQSLRGGTDVDSVLESPNSPFLPGADLRITFKSGASGGPVNLGYDFGAGSSVIAFGVPEPSSFALAGLGLFGLAGFGWRRRRNS